MSHSLSLYSKKYLWVKACSHSFRVPAAVNTSFVRVCLAVGLESWCRPRCLGLPPHLSSTARWRYVLLSIGPWHGYAKRLDILASSRLESSFLSAVLFGHALLAFGAFFSCAQQLPPLTRCQRRYAPRVFDEKVLPWKCVSTYAHNASK